MDNSTYASLSLASALQRSMDVTANNMANLNTAGFKAERSVFETYVSDESSLDVENQVNYVRDGGSYLDTRSGALSPTGNPFDLAIQGGGWFGYTTPQGQLALGRDGQLTVDNQGFLVTTGGAQILDAGGAPIAIPPDAGAVTMANDGTLSTAAGVPIAQVGVFSGEDIQGYQRLGNGMLAPPDGENAVLAQVAEPRVVQGMLELSNVEPVTEMTRMMEIQRAYEQAMNLTEGDNSLKQDLLQRLRQQPS